MVYGIYQSAAGLQLNQYRQTVLANNLANADTVGFKHDMSVVRERRIEREEDLVNRGWSDPVLDEMTGGSLVSPTYTTFDKGSIQVTGNPLDVALSDPGFFQVLDGDQVRYTRDGRFTTNRQGELVTSAGNHPVLDQSGNKIVMPVDGRGRARIDGSGTVRIEDQVFGRIGVVDFEDPSRLRKIGGNLFKASGVTPPRDTQTALRTGAVEMSTVDPTGAMVTMIEVSRAYELNATLVSLADSTLGRAVNDIARVR